MSEAPVELFTQRHSQPNIYSIRDAIASAFIVASIEAGRLEASLSTGGRVMEALRSFAGAFSTLYHLTQAFLDEGDRARGLMVMEAVEKGRAREALARFDEYVRILKARRLVEVSRVQVGVQL